MSDTKEKTVRAGKGVPTAKLSGAPLTPSTDDSQTPMVTVGEHGEAVLARGTVLKRYVVLDKLGQGGMATVYTAYDTELHRRVALKLLRYAAGRGNSGNVRLLREAQALAQLSHPNVVGIYDVGSVVDQVFMAMELVDGGDLKQWLRERKRGWREILDVFIAAGRGLSAAHAAGLIHRDFKPANVLVGSDGRIRVTDFGLARGSHDEPDDLPATPVPAFADDSHSGPRLIDVTLTQAGCAIGTPAYMAPEQKEALDVDARTNQYSFCAALHEALHGELPAADVTPSSPTVPAWIDRALARGLRSQPAARFGSMDELLGVLSVDPDRDRRRRRAVVAMSALALLALVGGGLTVRHLVRRQSLLCRGAERKLAGVWDAGQRHAVEQRFLASGHPRAAATFAAVAGALDKYAREWTAMSTASCEATRIRGEQSEEVMTLRMVCLDNRLEETRALTELFTEADRHVVGKSTDAVAALGDLRRCADIETLRSPVAPPKDEAQVRAVNQLRSQLARAKARLDAGKVRDAQPLAQGAVEGAKRLDYAPLEAEAYIQLGHIEDNLGQSQNAYESYFAGLCEALRGRSFDRALEGITGLLFNATMTGKLEEGMRWARQADGLMALVSGNAALNAGLKANLLSTRGTLEEMSNHLDQAERDYRAAVAVFEKQQRPERLAALLNNLGSVLESEGHAREALATYQRSLDIIIKEKGPDHPLVAAKRANLAGALADLGRTAEALVEIDRALDIQRKAGLTASFQYGLILASRSRVLLQLERLDEAHRDGEAALAICEASMGKTSPYVANQLPPLAAIARAQKRPDEALRILTHARALDEQLHDDAALASALAGLAELHLDRGARALALPLAERALALRTAQAATVAELAEARFLLARSLGSSAADRARATAMALQAEADYRQSEADHGVELRKLDGWLAAAGVHRPELATVAK